MRNACKEHNALADLPVVILAGGLGTRLRPLVDDRPKALAPVGAQTFLQIQLALLREQGARHFVLCIGYRGEQIRYFLGSGEGTSYRIDYSVEKDVLLGTGGALKQAERFFQPLALVLNGDTYFAADYNRLVCFHREESRHSGALATLALARAENTERFGTVLLDAEGKHLIRFQEKTSSAGAESSGWLNAGAYVIERTLLDALPPDVPCSLERDVFPAALRKEGKLLGLPCSHTFYDIGTPADLLKFSYYYETVRAKSFSATGGDTTLLRS